MNIETVIKKLIEYEYFKKLILKDNEINLLKKYQERNLSFVDYEQELIKLSSKTNFSVDSHFESMNSSNRDKD